MSRHLGGSCQISGLLREFRHLFALNRGRSLLWDSYTELQGQHLRTFHLSSGVLYNLWNLHGVDVLPPAR